MARERLVACGARVELFDDASEVFVNRLWPVQSPGVNNLLGVKIHLYAARRTKHFSDVLTVVLPPLTTRRARRLSAQCPTRR